VQWYGGPVSRGDPDDRCHLRRQVCDDRPVAWALYAVGWSLGWLLLWSPRRLPAPTSPRRQPLAVVVPARDEAASLPRLLRAIGPQLQAGDELVVVDDHSGDETAAIARAAGVRVVPAPPLPAGWVGKPHACATGAAVTTAGTLVFLDADVRPGPRLLDGLAAGLTTAPDAVVSVQPWHDAERPGERLTALANVVTLMGSGAFTTLGRRVATDVAFGPVLALRRPTYDRVGGHARSGVRASLTEDIALGRAVGATLLFSDRRDATFRMYPHGFRQSFAGWSRTMAAGVAATRWWLLLGVAAWVTSLAGGPFAGWLAYPLSAVQVWVLGRRAGRVGPLLAAVYPVLVVVLVGLVGRAGWLRVRGTTTWKGRAVRAA
jgi:4,4'-diaponeurosporenoate glycosyltransferase